MQITGTSSAHTYRAHILAGIHSCTIEEARSLKGSAVLDVADGLGELLITAGLATRVVEELDVDNMQAEERRDVTDGDS
jgi:hypothetical protein